MYTESIILAGIIYVLGSIIAMGVAILIKGIYLGITLRDKLNANKSKQNWEGTSVATKPS